MAMRDSHLILRSCTKTEVCAFDCADINDTETDILEQYGDRHPCLRKYEIQLSNSDRYLQWRMINNSIYCVIIGTRLTV